MKSSFYNLAYLNKIYENLFFKHAKKIYNSGRYISGKYVNKFEKSFSKYNKSSYSIAVSNGFDAIKLSIYTLKLLYNYDKNDEVIVPANSYIASILPVNLFELKPVFVEPEKNFFTIDPLEIKKKISSKTKIIIVTHLYGHVANMIEICKLAKKYGIKIIEDCSQSHGSLVNKKKVGNFGAMGCFSLFPSKSLGSIGDAGIITTNNKKINNILRNLRNYGENNFLDYNKRKYLNKYKGFNCRMSEFDAALLSIKLKDLDRINLIRKNNVQLYLKKINNKKIILPKIKKNTQPSWHQFIILCKNRDRLKKYLLKHKIETKILYPVPPHKQKAYSEYKNLKLPLTEKIHNENLALPIEIHHSKKNILRVIKYINNYN
jgi:dTDP-4-amino-4,6-dideoxygalactose transaminase